ncbi:MAG: glucosaminidase domain-containing protein [Bacteroidota bacterium]
MLRKNNLLPILLCIIPCFLMNAETPAVVANYIEQYKDIAIREMHRSGIPASITLAQGLHESGLGKGRLARHSNNHFGIKCKRSWQGPTYYIEDDDYQNGKLVKSCFRAYDDPEDSYIDHTNFLMNNQRYAALFKLAPTDYVAWAKGLRRCGYATNPKYAEILIRTVRKYNLSQYDTPTESNTEAAFAANDPAQIPPASPSNPPSATSQPAMDYPSPPPAMLLPDNYVRNSFRKTVEQVQEQSQTEHNAANTGSHTVVVANDDKQISDNEERHHSPPAAIELAPDETSDRSAIHQSPRYNLGGFKRRDSEAAGASQQAEMQERGTSYSKVSYTAKRFKRRD